MDGGICYVDFCGDLSKTACDEVPDFDHVTIYLSGATCPGCIAAIQARLAALSASCDQRSQAA